MSPFVVILEHFLLGLPEGPRPFLGVITSFDSFTVHNWLGLGHPPRSEANLLDTNKGGFWCGSDSKACFVYGMEDSGGRVFKDRFKVVRLEGWAGGSMSEEKRIICWFDYFVSQHGWIRGTGMELIIDFQAHVRTNLEGRRSYFCFISLHPGLLWFLTPSLLLTPVPRFFTCKKGDRVSRNKFSCPFFFLAFLFYFLLFSLFFLFLL